MLHPIPYRIDIDLQNISPSHIDNDMNILKNFIPVSLLNTPLSAIIFDKGFNFFRKLGIRK